MTTLFRSNVYQEMYPDDKMMEAFGTLTPSAQVRNAYFFDLWMKRRSNSFALEPKDREKAKCVLKSFGLKEMGDYQIKDNCIRFEHKQDSAMFKIAYKENG